MKDFIKGLSIATVLGVLALSVAFFTSSASAQQATVAPTQTFLANKLPVTQLEVQIYPVYIVETNVLVFCLSPAQDITMGSCFEPGQFFEFVRTTVNDLDRYKRENPQWFINPDDTI